MRQTGRKRLAATALALALLASTGGTGGSAHAAGPEGIQAGWPIDNAGNILITDAVATRMAASGAGWIRLNFRLGPYASDTPAFYQKYDTVVNSLRSRGLQVVGLVTSESWPGDQTAWTANNFEHNGAGHNGGNPYLDNVAAVTARIAQHYQTNVKNWEVWNEPNAWTQNNGNGFFSGGPFMYPSNFAYLLSKTYSNIHDNNVPVNVVSGGVFGHDIAGFNTADAGADYLDSVYNAGINLTGTFTTAKNTYGSYPLDAVGQHIYINGGGNVDTTQFANYLEYIHNILKKWEGAGTTKKTWLTEFGWGTNGVTQAVQAANVTAASGVIKSKNYIAATQWFQLDDNSGANLFYGLYQSDGATAKQSLSAFQTAATYQGRNADGTSNIAIVNFFNSTGGLVANGSPFDNGGGPFVHNWPYGGGQAGGDQVQDYDGGSFGPNLVFASGHRIWTKFRTLYLLGFHGALKSPSNDFFDAGNGSIRQDFAGGSIVFDSLDAAAVTVGADNASYTVSDTLTNAVGPLSLSKVGTGVMTLAGANTYNRGTTVSGGAVIASHPAALGMGAVTVTSNALVQLQTGLPTAVVLPSITATTGGTFDLTNNSMVLRNTTAAQVRSLIQSSFNAGHWNGATGLTSFLAADSSTTAVGYASNALLDKSSFKGVTGLSPNDMLVRYTYYGDADLSGATTLDDFTLFLLGYQHAGSTWSQGDFDYSGLTTLDDFTLFLKGYQQQGAPLTQIESLLAGVPMSDAERAAMLAAVQAIPEPATPLPALAALAALAAAGMMRRRRPAARLR